MTDKNFKKYLDCYSGRRLLEQYSLNAHGTWNIYGEDSNCDMGGQHYEPLLYVYVGKLEEAIRHGVELPQFWQWGAGGRFELAKTNAAATNADPFFTLTYKDARDLVDYNDDTVRSKIAAWVAEVKKAQTISKKRAELERQKVALEKQLKELDK